MPSAKKILVLCWICCISIILHGKDTKPATLEQAEKDLKVLFSAMTLSRNDAERTRLADSIACLINLTLKLPGAFDYPFDSIRTMGKITSGDANLRIFTWNLPHTNGTNRYYGFLQYKSPDNILVFQLTDKSEDLPDPAQCSLSAHQWYGALIYEIIEKKVHRGRRGRKPGKRGGASTSSTKKTKVELTILRKEIDIVESILKN